MTRPAPAGNCRHLRWCQADRPPRDVNQLTFGLDQAADMQAACVTISPGDLWR